MTSPAVAERANFGFIRYAQAWEDADILLAAMRPEPGQRFLSICAAGDNTLSLLLLDPREIVAADLSSAQIACLKLRCAAYKVLDHGEFLELFGARPSTRRMNLLDRILSDLDPNIVRFWRTRTPQIVRYGAGNIGKFEGYFRLFRRFVLPLDSWTKYNSRCICLARS